MMTTTTILTIYDSSNKDDNHNDNNNNNYNVDNPCYFRCNKDVPVMPDPDVPTDGPGPDNTTPCPGWPFVCFFYPLIFNFLNL